MTGEPYALIAHVRFGGRGDESHPYPYLYMKKIVATASFLLFSDLFSIPSIFLIPSILVALERNRAIAYHFFL